MREPIHPPWTELTEARENAELTRAKLAEKSGFTRSYIGDLEDGHRLGAGPHVIRTLARALKVPVNTLRRKDKSDVSAAS
ncbi:MAG: helix-turn-helix transcriptional regulator [Dermatophilaceae bacterium]|nr:helix-turn-helix transcriptional regulator [Dermatophilaceae bacterium]